MIKKFLLNLMKLNNRGIKNVNDNEEKMPSFLMNNGYPTFDYSKFRSDGGAGYTCIFGPDFSSVTGKLVRQHLAWDRGKGNIGVIFTPFDLDKIEGVYNQDFGYLVIMYPSQSDFTIRVAHMHPGINIDPDIRKIIGKGVPVAKNTYIGTIGSYSITYPTLLSHSHTEIVSINSSSKILDWAVRDKLKCEKYFMNDDELRIYMKNKYEEHRKFYPQDNLPDLNSDLEEELFKAYKHDLAGRRVLDIGEYSAVKKDYLDNGVIRTWYSSKDLLNF